MYVLNYLKVLVRPNRRHTLLLFLVCNPPELKYHCLLGGVSVLCSASSDFERLSAYR
jgi:hypothetical protein